MGYVIKDRVKDTTTTTGTGTVTVTGTAPTGFIAFATAASTGDNFYYCISSSGGSEWEVGLGTLVTGTTISRDSVLASSNANALVNLSAGTKDIFMTLAADNVPSTGKIYAYSAGNLTL